MKKMFCLSLLMSIFSLVWAQEVKLSNYQIDTVLSLHNFYRNILGTDSITWSSQLALKAEEWLKKYNDNPLVVYNSYGYRQNLYFLNDTNVANAVIYWAKEQVYYYPNANDFDKLLFKHYDNIIDPEIHHIGCAMIKAQSGLFIFVCFYSQ